MATTNKESQQAGQVICGLSKQFLTLSLVRQQGGHVYRIAAANLIANQAFTQFLE